MLDTKTIKKICDFIYIKPRSVQEVALHIGKNWRTADAYIDRIMKEQGTVQSRTFRGGTRGALKIVYWNNVEKIHSSDFQERLFKKIESGKEKGDFNPFDIYQYVDKEKRSAFFEEQSEYLITEKQNLISALKSAESEVMIFSGNLSWANASQGNKTLIKAFEDLAKRNIQIKILCRVDIESKKNIEKMLTLNNSLGKELIEIRHCEQPLRAFVVDGRFARFKEMKDLSKNSKTYIFYDIRDEEWIEWIKKVFWNFFRASIKADKRISDINTIERIK